MASFRVRFNGNPQIRILTRLSSGGSKTAYRIADDPNHVVLLPNTDRDKTFGYWEEMMECEIAVARSLAAVGILTANPTPVELQFEDGMILSAYIATSFEAFAQRGIQIFEPKFEVGYRIQFDPRDLEAWKDFLSEYVEDILKVSNWRLGDDAFNVAIVNHRLRYFGFDFVGKYAFCPNSQSSDNYWDRVYRYLWLAVTCFASDDIAAEVTNMYRQEFPSNPPEDLMEEYEPTQAELDELLAELELISTQR